MKAALTRDIVLAMALSALFTWAWAGQGIIDAVRDTGGDTALPASDGEEQLAYVCQGGAISGYASGRCVSTRWYCTAINPYYQLCGWCASINWSDPVCR